MHASRARSGTCLDPPEPDQSSRGFVEVARVAKSGVREKVGQAAGTLRREVEAIFAIAGACYLGVSFLSYSQGRPAGNVGGPVGHLLADLFVQAFGLAA